MMNHQAIARLIFELGHLRRIKHEGWRLAGVEAPDSVAEHSLRASQIAYLLARMEEHPEPHKAVTMTVFHDIAETRVGDVHYLASRYVDKDEERAVKEQLEELPWREDILGLWQDADRRKTSAGVIAKDADLLEQAFLAKEYVERGYASAPDWIDNVTRRVKTKSAKALLAAMQKQQTSDWWQGKKKIPEIDEPLKK